MKTVIIDFKIFFSPNKEALQFIFINFASNFI